jgi:hypothetical protein
MSGAEKETAKEVKVDRTEQEAAASEAEQAAAEQAEAHKASHLDLLWERYYLKRTPGYLAAYIELGGDLSQLDEVTRKIIADALDAIPVKPSRHKPNDTNDINAFTTIEKWRAEKALKANDGRVPTLVEAWEVFADQRGHICGYSGWRDRYNRGKKLLAPILRHPKK